MSQNKSENESIIFSRISTLEQSILSYFQGNEKTEVAKLLTTVRSYYTSKYQRLRQKANNAGKHFLKFERLALKSLERWESILNSAVRSSSQFNLPLKKSFIKLTLEKHAKNHEKPLAKNVTFNQRSNTKAHASTRRSITPGHHSDDSMPGFESLEQRLEKIRNIGRESSNQKSVGKTNVGEYSAIDSLALRFNTEKTALGKRQILTEFISRLKKKEIRLTSHDKRKIFKEEIFFYKTAKGSEHIVSLSAAISYFLPNEKQYLNKLNKKPKQKRHKSSTEAKDLKLSTSQPSNINVDSSVDSNSVSLPPIDDETSSMSGYQTLSLFEEKNQKSKDLSHRSVKSDTELFTNARDGLGDVTGSSSSSSVLEQEKQRERNFELTQVGKDPAKQSTSVDLKSLVKRTYFLSTLNSDRTKKTYTVSVGDDGCRRVNLDDKGQGNFDKQAMELFLREVDPKQSQRFSADERTLKLMKYLTNRLTRELSLPAANNKMSESKFYDLNGREIQSSELVLTAREERGFNEMFAKVGKNILKNLGDKQYENSQENYFAPKKSVANLCRTVANSSLTSVVAQTIERNVGSPEAKNPGATSSVPKHR